MIVMALVSGVILTTLASGAKPHEQAIRKAQGELLRIRDNVIIEANPIGFDVIDGYPVLYRYRDGKWRASTVSNWPDDAITDITTALLFDLPNDSEDKGDYLFLKRDGTETEKDKDRLTPPVIFAVTGEVTPFSLELNWPDERYRLSMSSAGEIEVTRVP